MARAASPTGKHDSRADVAAAIKQLRDFYRIGCESLRKRPFRKAGDQLDRDSEAAAHGVNSETLYKIRVFADPRRGYTEKELEELCQLCRDQGRALGFTMVIQFLAVPRRQRRAFQRRAVVERWSVARTRLERLQVVGERRSDGGKPPRVPNDLHALLAELESRSLYFVRLQDRLTEEEKEKKKKERDGNSPPFEWADLPEPVQREFSRVTNAIKRLRTVLGQELNITSQRSS